MATARAFWWRCIQIAHRGTTPFANDWAWLIGVPAVIGVLGGFASSAGVPTLTGIPLVDGLLAAAGAFFITYGFRFVPRLFKVPARLFYREERKVAALHGHLKPALKIFFDRNDKACVHETHFGDDQARRVLYIAVIPTATSGATVTGCEGYLVDVRKWNATTEEWDQTSFSMSQRLEWGAFGFTSVDIGPSTRRPLNVARIARVQNRIELLVDVPLNKDARLFDNRDDVFRFDIVVTAQGVSDTRYSLRLQMGEAWNQPKIEAV